MAATLCAFACGSVSTRGLSVSDLAGDPAYAIVIADSKLLGTLQIEPAFTLDGPRRAQAGNRFGSLLAAEVIEEKLTEELESLRWADSTSGVGSRALSELRVRVWERDGVVLRFAVKDPTDIRVRRPEYEPFATIYDVILVDVGDD